MSSQACAGPNLAIKIYRGRVCVQSNDLGGQNASGVLKVCPLVAAGLNCKWPLQIYGNYQETLLSTPSFMRPVTLLVLTLCIAHVGIKISVSGQNGSKIGDQHTEVEILINISWASTRAGMIRWFRNFCLLLKVALIKLCGAH